MAVKVRGCPTDKATGPKGAILILRRSFTVTTTGGLEIAFAVGVAEPVPVSVNITKIPVSAADIRYDAFIPVPDWPEI